MKKAKKKVTAKKVTKHTQKGRIREHRDDGVYWYGIHIRHVGLGVASAGTFVLVLLVQQIVR